MCRPEVHTKGVRLAHAWGCLAQRADASLQATQTGMLHCKRQLLKMARSHACSSAACVCGMLDEMVVCTLFAYMYDLKSHRPQRFLDQLFAS